MLYNKNIFNIHANDKNRWKTIDNEKERMKENFKVFYVLLLTKLKLFQYTIELNKCHFYISN